MWELEVLLLLLFLLFIVYILAYNRKDVIIEKQFSTYRLFQASQTIGGSFLAPSQLLNSIYVQKTYGGYYKFPTAVEIVSYALNFIPVIDFNGYTFIVYNESGLTTSYDFNGLPTSLIYAPNVEIPAVMEGTLNIFNVRIESVVSGAEVVTVTRTGVL